MRLLQWLFLAGVTTIVSAVLVLRWALRRLRRAVAARVQALLPRSGSWLDQPAVLGLRARVPGDGRQVATVRRDVQADLRGAQRAVAAGRRSGRPVGDLERLTARLADQVRDLDTDLAVVGSETDRDRRARLLAERQPQVAALRRACDQVREGVLLASTPTHGPLAQEIEDEVLRLRLRASAYRELTGRT